jgi:colanic acid/amylovoran biosynthesis glycosyltransferase
VRVYAFAEFYPNPFKPYLDAQFAQTIEDGHEVSVFAFGTWGDPGSRVIADFQLERRTTYLPAAIRRLPRFIGPSLVGAMTRGGRMMRVARHGSGLATAQIVSVAQAALLPTQAPDLCFIHDLGTAVRLTAIRLIYPHTRVALYYHGGEVAPGVVRDDAAARAGFALADAVFTNTAFSRSEAIGRGCPADRVHVIPVGFDIRQFPFVPERVPTGVGPIRLVVAGRLSRDKGIEHAIDAVGLLDAAGIDVECTIIGDGDEREALERRVAAATLTARIRLVGTLAHHDVISALSAADAILLPSVPNGPSMETQACVLQEAMLVGTALVASRIGGIPESVPPPMHEFLVPQADAGAIAVAVRKLAAMGQAQRMALARANRAFCESRYDVAVLNRRMLAAAMNRPSAEWAA